MNTQIISKWNVVGPAHGARIPLYHWGLCWWIIMDYMVRLRQIYRVIWGSIRAMACHGSSGDGNRTADRSQRSRPLSMAVGMSVLQFLVTFRIRGVTLGFSFSVMFCPPVRIIWFVLCPDFGWLSPSSNAMDSVGGIQLCKPSSHWTWTNRVTEKLTISSDGLYLYIQNSWLFVIIFP